MKGNKRKLMALHKQLQEKRRYGCKKVNWKLNKEQFEFLTELGYDIEPSLYLVRTRCFANISKAPSIIKYIHFKAKKGTCSVGMRLTDEEKLILDSRFVKYTPLRYEIKLCRSEANTNAA